MASVKKAIKALYGSKLGKILPVLVIAGLVATASASVFVVYYGQGTATARNNDLHLVAGPDSTSCTTNTPCINVGIASTNDYATIAMNLGKSATNSPQPTTYFTDPLEINNAGSTARTVSSVTITSATATTPANDYGSITVYYCTSQTDTPATSCADFYSITGDVSSPQTVFSGSDSIAASGYRYIEIVGYFGSAATAGTDTITFNVQIQWA